MALSRVSDSRRESRAKSVPALPVLLQAVLDRLLQMLLRQHEHRPIAIVSKSLQRMWRLQRRPLQHLRQLLRRRLRVSTG